MNDEEQAPQARTPAAPADSGATPVARGADVAGGDRREAERREGSNDSRREQMNSCICSQGIRFLGRGKAAISSGFQRLRGKDSNLDYLIQSQASYH
jgi:hypothetical protein